MSVSACEMPLVVNKALFLNHGCIKEIIDASDFNTVKPESHTNLNLADEQIISALLNRKEKTHYKTFIKLTNVGVTYGNKQILKDINWEIKQGERWALLGHNGAGKSTLLSLIYGDNPQAYANDIILFDRKRGSGESIWDIKKKCGFVSPELFQYFPADNNCLHVIESGFYDTVGLFRQSEGSRAATALKWMEILGIQQYQYHNLRNIPTAAQRLCLLARALVKIPGLLILDEPCQGMDNEQIENFKSIIEVICKRSNLTLIYVTHYPGELPSAVNRILKLNNGMIIS